VPGGDFERDPGGDFSARARCKRDAFKRVQVEPGVIRMSARREPCPLVEAPDVQPHVVKFARAIERQCSRASTR
jgi:hypothetical protein